ncbi:MAG: tRNA 2-thiouridine(34) synthase MnmA [Candidatus Latescibacteria bacterium]|nr:tRNA 2-thiouridine(34) synthase MnmA [Candidatus Latescibacterota bacterium]
MSWRVTAERRGTVAVAMSGGVDSSLTALLLAEQGYEVVGLTMLLHDEEERGDASAVLSHRCCGTADSAVRAREAALKAGGRHFTIDARAEFEKHVLDDFEREYSLGRTPNPCIRCNTYLKWGFLFEQARERGIEFFATGHHARIARGEKNGFLLKTATDPDKDQSYALWGIPRRLLGQTLLPIGEMPKSQVRALAARHGLAAAYVPDSQEICFIPSDNYRDYLEKRLSEIGSLSLERAMMPGDVVDAGGNVLGRHRGVAHFTVGQRHGLGVAAGYPLFVTRLDPSTGTVVVDEERGLWRSEFSAGGANWVSIDPPDEPFRARVRIRYSSTAAPALVSPGGRDYFTVTFDEPQRAITPGQSAVIYRNEIVLGGGIILE